MSMKIIIENWRAFLEEKSEEALNEQDSLAASAARKKGEPEAPTPSHLHTKGQSRDLEPPESIKRPELPKVRGSAVIGDLRGTGKVDKYKTVVAKDAKGNPIIDPETKKKKKIKKFVRSALPYGLFINGEHLGEDPRWILGANMQGSKKPHHYGTNELIRTIKGAVDYVHATTQKEYDRKWLAYILGESGQTEVAGDDEKYIKYLKEQNIIPKETSRLFIEDLGMAPYHTDMYGNTYHGGHKVPGHGSHQTGQDADLAFYMMPGYEMLDGFRVASPPRKLLKGFISRADLEFLTTPIETVETPSLNEKKKLSIKRHKRKVKDKLRSLKNRLGTFDPIRTWKLIAGLVNSGLVRLTIVDGSLHRSLRRAAELFGEKSLWSKAKFDPHTPNHKNHIHVRVSAPESIKRGKSLAKLLTRDFKKQTNTKSWLSRKMRRGKLDPGQKLYPDRDHWQDMLAHAGAIGRKKGTSTQGPDIATSPTRKK